MFVMFIKPGMLHLIQNRVCGNGFLERAACVGQPEEREVMIVMMTKAKNVNPVTSKLVW